MNVKLFKIVMLMIKYGVVLSAVVLITHVALLIKGYNYPFAEWLCGLSAFGFTLLFLASYVLKFCDLFRLFLMYDFVVSQCIQLQRSYHIFGNILYEVRMAVVVYGVALIAVLIMYNDQYKDVWITRQSGT